jgi:F-type H+-transporting ATPase subunit delta
MGVPIDSRELAVARVYALALLALAEEQGRGEEVGEELAALAAVVTSDETSRAFLASPLVSEEERRTALETAFRGRLQDLTVDVLQVMNRKRRLAVVPALALAYRRELDRRRGRVDVDVASAVPLSESLRERLHAALAAMTGREPVLHERVDAELVAGLRLAIGDRKIDGSVAARLRRLDLRLLERAPRDLAGLME